MYGGSGKFYLRRPKPVFMETTLSRKKYDSFLVLLYSQGKEHVLPEEFRRTIPYSTTSTWRKTDYSGYYGAEYRHIQEKGMEWYELHNEYRRLEKVTRVFSRVWVSVSKVVMPVLHGMKEYKELLVNETQRLFTAIPKKVALKVAGFTSAAFDYQVSKLRQVCGASPLSLCFKRHPMQLSLPEVQRIKELLSDPAMICWPLVSIYYKALREGKLACALSTLYKYATLLGLKRKFPSRIPKTVGLRASRPNEYLHVDTTYVMLPNGVKAAAVFVSDNFSRAILGWSIGTRNSGENVKKALAMALDTMKTHHPDLACATLVADGGSENNAVTVAEFLASAAPPLITKVVALKDISFSNSPIEAIHKMIKRYISHHKPQNLPQLETCIRESVPDYSCVRPHGSLKGLTPMETYTGNIPSMDFSAQIAQATIERVEKNRKMECGKYF